MTTFASLFTGFGGADIGAKQAGLESVWGVDYDKKIVDVSQRNHAFPIHCASVIDFDASGLPSPDIIHLSPPCQNSSPAKRKSQKTAHLAEMDTTIATAAAYIALSKSPKIITIENVIQYKKTKAWATLKHQITSAGYSFNYAHINMANYGVPQNRRRLIAWCVKDRFWNIPPPPTTKRLNWDDVLIPFGKAYAFTERLADRARDKFGLVYPDNSGFSSGNGWHAKRGKPGYVVTASCCNIIYHTPYTTIDLHQKAILPLQTFPKSFKLPPQKGLSMRGIGNAVPPLFMKQLYTHLLEVVR